MYDATAHNWYWTGEVTACPACGGQIYRGDGCYQQYSQTWCSRTCARRHCPECGTPLGVRIIETTVLFTDLRFCNDTCAAGWARGVGLIEEEAEYLQAQADADRRADREMEVARERCEAREHRDWELDLPHT